MLFSKLIRASREGDGAAFSELCKKYSPLIESMTDKYYRMTEGVSDREDLRQEASVAFFRAVTTFDLSQSEVSFGLYAKICIRNKLVSVVRTLRRQPSKKSLSEVQTGKTFAPSIDRDELMLYAKTVLSSREMKVLVLYLDSKSYKEIADLLSITEKSVDNALFRAKSKLKEYFN